MEGGEICTGRIILQPISFKSDGLLDTAAPATDLIDMYVRWGYTVIGECDWRPKTNYLSVVVSRPIAARGATGHVR